MFCIFAASTTHFWITASFSPVSHLCSSHCIFTFMQHSRLGINQPKVLGSHFCTVFHIYAALHLYSINHPNIVGSQHCFPPTRPTADETGEAFAEPPEDAKDNTKDNENPTKDDENK